MLRNIMFSVILLSGMLVSMTQAQHNPYKAPLYWSVYENQIVKEQSGSTDVFISEGEWKKNIAWVKKELKPFGYTMICIDGWGDLSRLNENGYRTSHSTRWIHGYAWWSKELQRRGMTLGMYGNPLWIHVNDDDTNTLIIGTDIPVSTLKNSGENAKFNWVQVDRPGAEEYVKGWIRFYADMGIKYYRIDFLSWYEDGKDRNLGRVGPERPRAHYETALRWMREEADACGMFLSLVMPHLNYEADAEKKYGHMIRINDDALGGTWHRWSEDHRGEKRDGWSVYANPADGLTYWSSISGKNKIILDPDFLRINTFANNEEKMSVISLCLMAGAPISVADQHNTIGDNLWVYTNKEMLALNQDGFVGHPLTNDPANPKSQIWTGQKSNGDWIVGLFNREDKSDRRGIDFSTLGIEGPANVRDLWAHEDLGDMSSFYADIPPHGCRVIKIQPADQ